jgi:hypothetical protein
VALEIDDIVDVSHAGELQAGQAQQPSRFANWVALSVGPEQDADRLAASQDARQIDRPAFIQVAGGDMRECGHGGKRPCRGVVRNARRAVLLGKVEIVRKCVQRKAKSNYIGERKKSGVAAEVFQSPVAAKVVAKVVAAVRVMIEMVAVVAVGLFMMTEFGTVMAEVVAAVPKVMAGVVSAAMIGAAVIHKASSAVVRQVVPSAPTTTNTPSICAHDYRRQREADLSTVHFCRGHQRRARHPRLLQESSTSFGDARHFQKVKAGVR